MPTFRALPLLVVALILPPFIGFVVVGPALGVALGSAMAVALITWAARQTGNDPFELAPVENPPFLILGLAAVETPEQARELSRLAARDRERDEERLEVLVIAPARASRLDRWTDDLEQARIDAQRVLTLSVATLTAAGLRAEGRVVDENPLRAVEDTLAIHGGSGLAIVAGPDTSAAADRTATDITPRLAIPVHRVGPRQ